MFVGPIVAWLAASPVSPALNVTAPYANNAPAPWSAVGMAISTTASTILALQPSPKFGIVVYDPEPKLTPVTEIANIAQTEAQVCAYAHHIGARCIETPVGPEPYMQVALDAACSVADGVDFQMQLSETNLPVFTANIHNAVARCKTFNPNIEIIVGISTRGGHTTTNATPAQIESAINAVSDVTNRYWFNVPQPGTICPGCPPFSPTIAESVISYYASLH